MIWFIFDTYGATKEQAKPEFLLDTAKSFNVVAQIRYTPDFSFDEERGVWLYGGKSIEFELPKVCLFRCPKHDLGFWLQSKGVKVVNKPEVIEIVRDKIATHKVLENHGIPQPKFLELTNQKYEDIVERVGTPFVMKDNFGMQGKGVFLIENKEQFKNSKKELTRRILCQEYIPESFGRDVRFYYVGNKLRGVGERINETNDFRSNIAQGGHCELFKPTLKQKHIAKKIAKLLHLEVGSVDFLIKGDKLIFCEANSSAGYQMFVPFGIYINEYIINYLKRFDK